MECTDIPPAAGDNLEEFQDPANYDLEEGEGAVPRAAYYGDLAAAVGGPVLEIACGTGLVTLPVARRASEVVGVDIAPAMLEHARARARVEGLAVEFREADARALALERRFRLVFLTGNAFQAFLRDDDQAALLDDVRRHPLPGGTLAFETRNPAGHDLGDRPGEEHWFSYADTTGRPVRVSGTQRYDRRAGIMHWTTIRRREGSSVASRTRIACRFTDVDALDRLLHRHGFEVTARSGDWDRRPFEACSPSIITECGIRPRAADA